MGHTGRLVEGSYIYKQIGGGIVQVWPFFLDEKSSPDPFQPGFGGLIPLRPIQCSGFGCIQGGPIVSLPCAHTSTCTPLQHSLVLYMHCLSMWDAPRLPCTPALLARRYMYTTSCPHMRQNFPYKGYPARIGAVRSIQSRQYGFLPLRWVGPYRYPRYGFGSKNSGLPFFFVCSSVRGQ